MQIYELPPPPSILSIYGGNMTQVKWGLKLRGGGEKQNYELGKRLDNVNCVLCINFILVKVAQASQNIVNNAAKNSYLVS